MMTHQKREDLAIFQIVAGMHPNGQDSFFPSRPGAIFKERVIPPGFRTLHPVVERPRPRLWVRRDGPRLTRDEIQPLRECDAGAQ